MSAQRNGKWYAVTAVGVPLDKATLVFEEGSDGLLRPLKTLERKELAQGLRQRAGLMPTPVEAEEQAFAKCFFAACKHGEPVEARSARAVEAVRMLVRVADGRVVAREAVNIPAEAQAFARAPHPGTATGCWEAVRAVEAERNRLALEMVAAEWPRCLRERRLALRDARIRVLLDGAAAAGDVSARVRLGREAYERHDDAEAARRLAGLEDRDAMARAVLAVMGLEGRLPEGVLAPEVRAGDPWPLAVPSRQAFALCLAAVKRAGASPQGAEDAWKAHVDCGVVERLQGAARAGYPFAQWWLARLYKEGVGVARSPERAGTWLAAAAAAGRPEALGELAALRQDAGDAALPPWCGVQAHNPLWDGLRGEDPDLDFFALAAKRHNPAALVVVARRTVRQDPARQGTLPGGPRPRSDGGAAGSRRVGRERAGRGDGPPHEGGRGQGAPRRLLRRLSLRRRPPSGGAPRRRRGRLSPLPRPVRQLRRLPIRFHAPQSPRGPQSPRLPRRAQEDA